MIPQTPGPDRDLHIFLWIVVMAIAIVTIVLLGLAGQP